VSSTLSPDFPDSSTIVQRRRPRSNRLPWGTCAPQVGEPARFGFTSNRDWNPLELLQAQLGMGWKGSDGEGITIDLTLEDLGGFYDSQPQLAFHETRKPDLPFDVCAKLAAQRLSVSKSDLAKLFGISRPTLYAWMNGEAEPRDESHRRKLTLLGALVEELFQDSARPLYHRFVYQPMPGEMHSLVQVLGAEPLDPATIRRLMAQAMALTRNRDQHLGQPTDLPREVQEQGLHDNLLSLGGE